MYKFLYHSKCYTGKFLVTREDQADQEQIGEARKIWRRWALPRKKLNQQLSTDKNGVGVWPNASTWMRDESSLRSSLNTVKMKAVSMFCVNYNRRRPCACVRTVEVDEDVDDALVSVVGDNCPSISNILYTGSLNRRRTGIITPVYTSATRNTYNTSKPLDSRQTL